MAEIKFLRSEAEQSRARLIKRSTEHGLAFDKLIDLDQKRRIIQKSLDDLKAKRNQLSKSVKSLDEAETIKSEVQNINGQISTDEKLLLGIDQEIELIWLTLPNLPADDVPEGKDEQDNKVVKLWGSPPTIDQPQDHCELGERLGILDMTRSARLSGSRFSSFVGVGARLQKALINFMLDEVTQNGYLEIAPPLMVKEEILRGTGQIPKFKEDQYGLSESEHYLIPTAEVPLTAFFAEPDKPLNLEQLPLRLCAYTPCFRKEAGAAGRDSRGLIRLHQFDKVELVHICKPEDSLAEHEKMLEQAESILQKLGLSYRVLELCTGDLGFSAAKCYDLEVWFPSQGQYREISSCSNCTDFQAIRLGLKFKRSATAKSEFVHTLNGSCLAVGRCWAALVENYQQPNGSISIPVALRKYLNDQSVIERCFP